MMINELNVLLNTLNCIEVRGKTNMDYLLGSIQLVEKMIDNVKNPPVSVEESEVTDGR